MKKRQKQKIRKSKRQELKERLTDILFEHTLEEQALSPQDLCCLAAAPESEVMKMINELAAKEMFEIRATACPPRFYMLDPDRILDEENG